MMWYGNGMSGWGYLLMIVTNLLFWALLVAAVVAVIRYVGGTAERRGFQARPTAEQLLAERFARGEIDEEEYHRRLDTLRSETRPFTTP